MIKPEQWRQVEQLYDSAVELEESQRSAYVGAACAGNEQLRREVESLLAYQKQAEQFLEVPALEGMARAMAEDEALSQLVSEADSDLTGRTLSHYRILEKLGAGGMGVVYKAKDTRLDRFVAVKVLPAGRLADDAARKRFRKEALALAKLNHPHIGTIYQFDTQEGVDFLVMEYIEGKTLAEGLESGALAEKDVLALGMQIVGALEEAHEHGVVHRDLKPRNILTTPKGQAKVLDFGLAKLLRPESEISTADELSSTAVAAGTLPYMAPEQLRGKPADARSDLYAAGTVLYEMVTGRRPFDAKVSPALAADIQAKAPIPPSRLNAKISPRLEEIILKCLEKEPDNRYQSAKELLVDLRRLSTVRPDLKNLQSRPLWLRPAAMVGLVLLALLPGAYIARQRFWPQPKQPPGKISLAVLPFANLSRDPQEDYFCDGLTDEMINQLGRLQPQRLGVIARTSAMFYKGSPKRVDEIGRELGVGYILETSVRREGGRVRIGTQLIQVRDQNTLWTENYEYDMAGVFALESDVAGRIARSLAFELLPGQQMARPPTTSPEAYDAYLKGRYHWHKGSAENWRKAREYFEQAVRIDPNYAPAYAGLAGYYWVTVDLPPSAAMPKAKEYALKALGLDDTLTQAHTALAGIRFYGDWDWPGAEREFKRALALNPSDAEAHRIYSFYLLALGRFEEALLEVERARELDPVSLLTSVNAGWTFYFARQYDRAIEQCRKALDLDANSDGAHDCLSSSYRAKGMGEEAIIESERAVILSGREPGRLAGLARAYAAFGRRDEAKRVLNELRERAKHSYVSPYLFAVTYAALGDENEALAALEQAYTERDLRMSWLKVDDALDPLRGERRFQDLLRHVGFTP